MPVRCSFTVVVFYFSYPLSLLLSDAWGAATATVFELALRLGKIPVIVRDGPGFLVNRILGPCTKPHYLSLSHTM
jgi:hypothetical protein